MLSFHMTADTAYEFYRRAKEHNAQTEDDRVNILLDMVAEGLINGVAETSRTKEEYIADLSKEFKVLDLTLKEKSDEKL